MKKIKVLIVDDSVVYRSQIKTALQKFSWLEVLGAAPNASVAIEKIIRKIPDLLILDLDLPQNECVEILTELKRREIICKILLLSSTSKKESKNARDAFKLGANDLAMKPLQTEQSDSISNIGKLFGSVLEPKISALFPDSGVESSRPAKKRLENSSSFSGVLWNIFYPEIVVIGSSTGGPTVLENIFAQLASPLSCPIVVAQHMPAGFTKSFAERLQKISGIPTVEATDGMILQDNCVYIAPGNYHLRLRKLNKQVAISLDQGPLINSVRPSVDPLFSTAAAIFGNKCLGIILTGMGADGKDGAIKIKEAGGAVLIQNEKSCVVFGMPGAVFSVGAFDKIGDPDEIAEVLKEKIISS